MCYAGSHGIMVSSLGSESSDTSSNLGGTCLHEIIFYFSIHYSFIVWFPFKKNCGGVNDVITG